ncbi:DUF2931 family protein [Hymenobacter terrenus]|uniref:DUF2931 family protein n=1 Tax=Hymenobacter terrenus TaxID=1629124 RepID=UPI000619370E|nr:DUF2931 family protein [Hymenobacter terrenus]
MFKPLFYLLLGGLLLAALATYHYFHRLEPYQTERFRLSAAPAAAEGYPMEVVEGRFLTSDGKSFPVAPGFLEGDWGLSHIGWSTGDGTAPAPDSLEVRWFSYTEDKFYEGHWLLPQRRIHDLLQQGFWNIEENKHETYHSLTLCLLPKGVAVVWLSGQNQVLLGRYEAREIDFDFKRFNEAANRSLMIEQEQAKLPPAVQQQIRTRTLSTAQWDAYLKTYPWKIQFSQPLKLYRYSVGYFNAEETGCPTSPDMTLYTKVMFEPNAKPIPSSMLLQVDAGYGRKRKIRVDSFDEAETLSAFQTLHAANQDLPLTLYIETDDRVDKARLWLKNDRQQVELVNAKVELYDAE